MFKFLKEKIKELRFKRDLKYLEKLPIMVVETTIYVEDVKKSHKAKENQPKQSKTQKKVNKNAKKRC